MIQWIKRRFGPKVYLPTIRTLITDEEKQRICTAPWDARLTSNAPRTTLVAPHLKGKTGYSCPLGLLDCSHAGIITGAGIAMDLGRLDLTDEAWDFIEDWDGEKIKPRDLPGIFGWNGYTGR